MKYANFWQRFAAAWIDFLVLLLVMVARAWLEHFSKTGAMVILVPVTFAYCAYTIYCHGRFGQTVGKHVVRIRVVTTSGQQIGWRVAWLRKSVDLPFALLGVIATFIALGAIPDSDYYGFSWLQRESNISAYAPSWHDWAMTCANIWIWSEVVVMLFNK